MKRSINLILAVLVLGNMLFAQSVDQGKRFLYYDRNKSAKESLEKIIAANPNNIEAIYWLGQTLLATKDSVAAKNLYQKALAANGNAPLLLVGMGQIELLEGKTNDARQRFETAISLTKGKDINVLNAIGIANVDAKAGDANYALEKLRLATQIKGFKDPQTYLIMGEAYRKLIDGGNAVISYNKALAIDPRMAAAKHGIAKVYLTQNNREYFIPAFEEAITMDPTYAPTYYELFYYWYFRDVHKAGGYLDKYIANADQGPEMEELKTDYLYASGKHAEAKTQAQNLINTLGSKVSPRMYKLIAYVCDTLQDMVCAKNYMTEYFAKQDPDAVLPADYEELANIYSKTPGSEQLAFENLQKAFLMDTAMENKIKYLEKGAGLAKKLGNRAEEANWLGIAYRLKKEPNNRDLYDYAFAHYQAGNYDSSYSLFSIYKEKYPDEIYGYLWTARSMQAKDSTLELGTAAQEYEKLAEAAFRIDSVKYKSQIVQAYGVLASYHNNVKKDKKTAIYYLQRIVDLDPSNNSAKEFINVLQKAPSKPPAQKTTKPATKKATGTTKPAKSSSASKKK